MGTCAALLLFLKQEEIDELYCSVRQSVGRAAEPSTPVGPAACLLDQPTQPIPCSTGANANNVYIGLTYGM